MIKAMAGISRSATQAPQRAEALEGACGQRVGDRRVRVPRKERSAAARLGAAVRRIIAR